jgi:hypothetical protein
VGRRITQRWGGTIMEVDKARIYYGTEFDEMLGWYLANGVVYNDKDLFVLAIRLNKDDALARKTTKDLDKLDAWYVQYASGNIKRLFQIMPEELEWAIFERHEGEKPRCYNLNRIRRKLGA